MIYKTKGIVLRTVKYGETSIVASIFTELFGIRTYMINGVRTTGKGGAKAALYQPAAILDMEVYNNEQKNMQRIKEAGWHSLYNALFSNVIKNSIALYMVELLHHSLKQPEENSELFNFCEDALLALDNADKNIAANLPLYFSLHLAQFFGFRIHDVINHLDEQNLFVDLSEGNFTDEQPAHPHFLTGEDARITLEILRIMQPQELEQLKLSGEKRRELLVRYHEYFALHIHDFGQMKTLQVLHEVLA